LTGAALTAARPLEHVVAFTRKFIFASLSLLLSASAYAAGMPIVEISENQRLPTRDPVLVALAMDPAMAITRSIEARPLLLDAGTKSVQFDLGAFRINADLRSSRRSRSGNMVWQGEVRETADKNVGSQPGPGLDPGNSIVLVRSGDRLTGNLRVHGQLFQIRPLASGGHVLVEVNEELMPPDHPEDYKRGGSTTAAQASPFASGTRYIQPVAGYGNSIISVMVVATKSAAAASGDMAALVDLAIAESNQGFANSNVRITLELAGIYTTDYVESGSFSTDLGRFRGSSDGYMDQFHGIRNQIGADVNMLVINNSSSCGLASAFAASAETAFAAVHWNCATGIYSFGHEIGHLIGARHDLGSDAASTPYAYGHGYRYIPASGEGWRTVMALDCPVSCPRLNFWSNPELSYRGIAMGNASSNNAKVLMHGRNAMSWFRSVPGSGDPLARTAGDGHGAVDATRLADVRATQDPGI